MTLPPRGLHRAAAVLTLLLAGCAPLGRGPVSIDPESVAFFALGTVAQVALHEGAHAAYADAENIPFTTHVDGISYRYKYQASGRREYARAIRMGYIADTATAEIVPRIRGWEGRPFLNGLYFGSVLDRAKASIEGEGDVPGIAETGGPSAKTLRALLGASVAADLARWRWPESGWTVALSASLHGALLVSFGREF